MTAPMDPLDVLAAAESRIVPALTSKYADLLAEVTRFRLVDQAEVIGTGRWFDAIRRFRDVADRHMGAEPLAELEFRAKFWQRVDEIADAYAVPAEDEGGA